MFKGQAGKVTVHNNQTGKRVRKEKEKLSKISISNLLTLTEALFPLNSLL